jgi:hypothetical protein
LSKNDIQRILPFGTPPISDSARMLINRLIQIVEGTEEYRGSRKNKRSEKARFTLRRAIEGFVGDLLRAYADKKSGGWIYRSQKANSFSGGDVSYRNFVAVVKTLGGFFESKVGYQEWSNGFDAGGPRLPIRTKATRFRAKPQLIELGRYCNVLSEFSNISDHFIRPLDLCHSRISFIGLFRREFYISTTASCMCTP